VKKVGYNKGAIESERDGSVARSACGCGNLRKKEKVTKGMIAIAMPVLR
jgi:hypothetical protein